VTRFDTRKLEKWMQHHKLGRHTAVHLAAHALQKHNR
jgi:hypothetical protein